MAWRWKQQKNKKHVIQRPESEWIELPGETTPAIVTPELWREANERIAANRSDRTRNERRPFLLRGHIICAVCGLRMAPERDKTSWAYRCTSRVHVGSRCSARSVPGQAVEAWVWAQVEPILRDPSIVAEEVERRRREGPDAALLADREATQRQLTKIERKQERLLQRFGDADDDSFPWELVEREIKQAEQEKARLRKMLSEIELKAAEQEAAIDQLAALTTYCARVSQNLETFDLANKRLAIEALNIELTATGRDWKLTGSIPLDASSGKVFASSG